MGLKEENWQMACWVSQWIDVVYFLDVRKVRNKEARTCTEVRGCLFFQVLLLGWNNPMQQVLAGIDRALCGGKAARRFGAAGGRGRAGQQRDRAGQRHPQRSGSRECCCVVPRGTMGSARLHHGERCVLLGYITWAPVFSSEFLSTGRLWQTKANPAELHQYV